MDLHWISIGNKSSSYCLVFLHEGLGCIEMWKDYPKRLCEELNIHGIVYDRSGYGKSAGNLTERSAQYLHEAAEELHEFLTELNVTRPILYGHSDGGSIALIYAAIHPQNVTAVITEAAHVFNEAETIAGVLAARPLLAAGKMEGLKKYHGDRYYEVFYAWNDIWSDESFKNWDITDLLPHIVAPQLIIQGQDDQYGTLKQVDSIASNTLGKTKTITPALCGHAPFKEQTELIFTEVVSFVHEII